VTNIWSRATEKEKRSPVRALRFRLVWKPETKWANVLKRNGTKRKKLPHASALPLARKTKALIAQCNSISCVIYIKALANEDTLLLTHCCSWCFLGCANWQALVADTKCFWSKSETFFESRTQNLCPQQMLLAWANGETFVSATMCPRLPGPLDVRLACFAFLVSLPVY